MITKKSIYNISKEAPKLRRIYKRTSNKRRLKKLEALGLYDIKIRGAPKLRRKL
jgi:hypothetical protein